MAALFAIKGSVIYRTFEPADRKERRKTPQVALHGIVANSPTDDMPSGEETERGYNMANMSRPRRNDYTPASDEDFSSTGSDDDAYLQLAQ